MEPNNRNSDLFIRPFNTRVWLSAVRGRRKFLPIRTKRRTTVLRLGFGTLGIVLRSSYGERRRNKISTRADFKPSLSEPEVRARVRPVKERLTLFLETRILNFKKPLPESVLRLIRIPSWICKFWEVSKGFGQAQARRRIVWGLRRRAESIRVVLVFENIRVVIRDIVSGSDSNGSS